jgi:hypothetical protein
MIILTTPNDKPQIEIGQAVAQDVPIKIIPTVVKSDFCLCEIGVKLCDYIEKAFYSDDNPDGQDFTDLFINKVDSTDEIEFILIDNITEEEFVLDEANENTYGKYSEDDNHKGLFIDFTTLHDNYPNLTEIRFRKKQKVFGKDLEEETHVFNLIPYSQVRADGTVRIQTVNNGRIESGADYGELDWRKSMRVKGFFGNIDFEPTIDNVKDGNRTVVQIQPKVERVYLLETKLLPQGILNMIAMNDILANEIVISDYNINNTNLKDVSVSFDEMTTKHYAKNQKGSFEMKFRDRVQNIVKRNK